MVRRRAGKAIDVSRTTACHALSYGLTIRWGVPHGHAVATSSGEMIVFNGESMPLLDADLVTAAIEEVLA